MSIFQIIFHMIFEQSCYLLVKKTQILHLTVVCLMSVSQTQFSLLQNQTCVDGEPGFDEKLSEQLKATCCLQLNSLLNAYHATVFLFNCRKAQARRREREKGRAEEQLVLFISHPDAVLKPALPFLSLCVSLQRTTDSNMQPGLWLDRSFTYLSPLTNFPELFGII